MNKTYTYEEFPYKRTPEQETGDIGRYPVVIVGAGPTGLTAANDLVQRGIPVVLLDNDNKVSHGSRAICFAKRTLEIFDRLGCVSPMRKKGVTWNIGKLFFRDQETYRFNLLPEEGHAHPAFINLQQYYVEQYLYDHLRDHPLADIRWLNEVINVVTFDGYVRLTVDTPEGEYQLEAEYLIAADGASSPTRKSLGLDYEGIVFEEKFLITDVVMKNVEFPIERWFWFDPPFNRGYSALLHSQPDDVWRIDLQLGREADPAVETKPERVIPRIQAMLGPEVEFDLEWISIYSFHSRMQERFVHGRVIFVGDSAHIMSPFGARGANSGIQDVDNLVWKLELVLEGKAPASLLESYNIERVYAAKENLLYTESSTEFISPNSAGQMALRNAVLELAGEYTFARPLINSGRLSTATTVPDSPLNTPDEDSFVGKMFPGAAATDAPVLANGNESYLLQQIGGPFFGMLYLTSAADLDQTTAADLEALTKLPVPVQPLVVVPNGADTDTAADVAVIIDQQGFVRERFDLQPGSYYLFRPDQYVCGRWRTFDLEKVKAAVKRAIGNW